MKEHIVSQSIALPTSTKVTINPSAEELMTDWLAARVERGIEMVINHAISAGVPLKEIWVAGHESHEELTREMWITVETAANHDDAYALWGVLADAFSRLNEPPPAGADNADVTVQIAVNW